MSTAAAFSLLRQLLCSWNIPGGLSVAPALLDSQHPNTDLKTTMSTRRQTLLAETISNVQAVVTDSPPGAAADSYGYGNLQSCQEVEGVIVIASSAT